MVRVAGLKGQQLAGRRGAVAPTGSTPTPAARRDRRRGRRADRQPAAGLGATCARRCATPASRCSATTRSTPSEAEWLRAPFRRPILPVLTPQAIDPAHPFPFIPNKGFSADLRPEAHVRRRADPRAADDPGDACRASSACRARRRASSPIETVIRRQFAKLFPGYELLGGGAFRVIRDSDIEIEEEAEDLVRYFRTRDQAPPPRPGDPPGARGRHARRARGAGPRGPRRRRRAGLRNRPASSASPTSAQLVEEDRPDLKFPPFSAALSRADPRI